VSNIAQFVQVVGAPRECPDAIGPAIKLMSSSVRDQHQGLQGGLPIRGFVDGLR
jgi:hypothetical protein